jgi:hypothetical protein
MADTAAQPSPETPPRRSRVTLLIVALLLIQVLVPLRYYLGLSGGDDERFSWRMFSTVRLQKCDASVSEVREGSDVPQRVSLKPILQVAWISILQRFRPTVVDRFMRFRCQTEGVTKVIYDRTCVAPDGQSLPPTHWELACDTGVMDEGNTP